MLQIWDASGNLIVGSSDRVGRFAPSPIYVSAGQSGSVSTGGTGEGFAFSVPVTSGTSPAEVSINGTTVSWYYYSGGTERQPAGDCYIYYGAY